MILLDSDRDDFDHDGPMPRECEDCGRERQDVRLSARYRVLLCVPCHAQRQAQDDPKEVARLAARQLRRSRLLYNGMPCSESFWVGASRDGLAQSIANRRHQQALPGDKDLKRDPMLAAVASWVLRRTEHRVAQRRKGGGV